MKIFIFIFLFALISCNKKQESSKSKTNVSTIIKQKTKIKNETSPVIKELIQNHIYNENDFDFTDLQINYGIGKFVFDEKFNEYIVDTTSSNTKDLSLFEILRFSDDYPNEVIRISNYVFSLQKNKGILYIGLFRRVEENNWKCIDVIKLEKYSDKGEYNYILGDDKIFSYACETNKGHSCYAIVIDKVNSEGKYDKILKAIKFDLANGKIIEIDLKKEKVECEPEGSCE